MLTNVKRPPVCVEVSKVINDMLMKYKGSKQGERKNKNQ